MDYLHALTLRLKNHLDGSNHAYLELETEFSRLHRSIEAASNSLKVPHVSEKVLWDQIIGPYGGEGLFQKAIDKVVKTQEAV